ncbi:nitroreductase [Lentisphaera marina]|uniref:nitroreductase n=1 Tax=Lentisphaera marina TaxID=1111041 RepID=UPI00236688E7|nr:nitroreductase [Lentisphaera marina]MDD7987524.1 nitroreductase [Lentisphaera marina]
MRHSVRAFSDRLVTKEQLEQAIDYARYAASSKNMQPWQIAICQGDILKKLSHELILAAQSGQKPAPELGESKDSPIPDLYMNRARQCGYSLFQHKGIERHDKEARLDHWCENYRFFGATTVIFFYYDHTLPQHCLIDMGIFLERLMQGLEQQGLSSCPQASLVSFPDILDKHIDMPQELSPIFGLSLGYEEVDQHINTFRTEKLSVNEITKWFN